jgi:hypothetical protein
MIHVDEKKMFVKKGIKNVILMLFCISVLALGNIGVESVSAETMNYADVTLSGGFQSGHFPEVWDLTECDLVISFTYDATGLVDDSETHAWGEIGIRQVGYGDFNPTWMTDGAGVWLSTDYDWTTNTFDPDPPGAPSLDLDDKMILQKGGGMGEGSYDLPSTPPNPWANHAVWFDRDGVDQYQALMWGAIDGVTYNTGGTYDIIITLHAISDSSGTAYMTINGEPQGFYDPNWHSGPADLMPAGMTFTGDMKIMQVFYGLYGYGATHTVMFEDITVEGCLNDRANVDIDVKPGSDPNSINLKSKGLLPIAILGSETVDVKEIDPSTIKIGTVGLATRGSSRDPKLAFSYEQVNGDEDVDMMVFFDIQELVSQGALDATTLQLILTGEFEDGTPLVGIDLVSIVPR